MTTEPHKANSEPILQTADVQTAGRPHLDVKEAARRLGVSRSVVYRLDRENGQIRFLSAKRPITLDAESVETYLASTSPIEPEPDTKKLDETGICPRECSTAPKGPLTSEVAAAAAPPAVAIRSAPTLQSSGQRELLIPKRERASVFMYMTIV